MNALPTPTHTQRLLTIASILLCSHTIGTAGSTNDENTFTKEGFLTAITNKDTQTIERYIDHDKNTYINMYDEDGAKTTALFAVIQNDNTNNKDQNDFIAKKEALVNKLITQGANTTHKDTSLKTALHLAIQADLSIDTIKRLLGPNKENLNAANNHTYTPMYWARLHKKPIQLMQWLIEQGANLNAQYSSNTGVSGGWSSDEDNDNQNKTETLLQVAQNDLQKAKDNDMTEPENLLKKIQVVQLLQESVENATKDANDVQAFKKALQEEELDTIKEYINKNKVYIDTTEDEDNMTALFIFIDKNDQAFVQQLLKKGANVNHRQQDGYTPLFFGYLYSVGLDMMKLLLEHNADLDIKYGEEQQTLLEIAKKENKADVVNLLQTTKNKRKKALGIGGGQNRNTNNNLGLNNDEQKNDTNNNINNNGQNNNTGQKPKDDKRLQKFAGIAAVVIVVGVVFKWITTPPPTPDKRTRARDNAHQARYSTYRTEEAVGA